jgi:hypothetical protein
VQYKCTVLCQTRVNITQTESNAGGTSSKPLVAAQVYSVVHICLLHAHTHQRPTPLPSTVCLMPHPSYLPHTNPLFMQYCMQSQFYSSHPLSLPCPTLVFCETKATPFSKNTCSLPHHTTYKTLQLGLHMAELSEFE